MNSLIFSNIDIEIKVKNISLIVFAITVMKIRLGKSRLFMKPNIWIMESAEDPKDLNPALEVAALKIHASQDAVGPTTGR